MTYSLKLSALALLLYAGFSSSHAEAQLPIPRGRPQLNAARTTFVADNGQLLRGPYESTEWTTAAPASEVAKMKTLGFNAVHLYAEVFDPNYPNAGSTAPGYAVAEVDKMVQMTRTNGLYLIMTIGNGANNGDHNLQWATNFWNFYAPRYANETHVLYEIHNEPVAWGPPYSSANATPPGAMNLEIAAYNIIRAHAPDTPVLLFSYAVLGGTGGADAAMTDIRAFNQAVFGNQNAVWTNMAVGFHGYAGASAFEVAVSNLIRAGYPSFQTEFGSGTWGGGPGGLDVEGVSILERLGVSWLTFAYIPPSGVSDDVTRPEAYVDRVDNSGLSWTPDYGTWPVARGVYGNNGYPWTTPDYVNNTLSGTLRIQAENFDNGGKGVAYYNENSSNPGGQYRTDETVGIQATSDTGGGYNVSWTDAGDWLEYTMKVSSAGTYNLRLRVAGTSDGSVRVLAGGGVVDLTGEWTLPNTGGDQIWTTVTRSVFLTPGQQKLRINVLAGGFNLNWIEFSVAPTGPLANGTYKFLNAASGLALDVNANNNVVPTPYTGSSYQHWNLQHIGGGQYRVSSAANGQNWNTWAGPVHLIGWWGAAGDRCFIMRPTGGGYYRVFSAGEGTCLEPSSDNPPALNESTYTGTAGQQWAIVSPSTPSFPANVNATASSATQAILTWNAVPGATSYRVKRSTTSGGPYTTIASGLTSTNHADAGLVTGFSYYYVVSAMVGATESLNSMEVVVLPPWRWQDIGATGVAGSTTYSDGVFAMAGSGEDIWGTADAFRFAYLTASGNFSIVARVTSVQNTDGWAKAGVMIRSSLAANSAHAFVPVTPGNGVAWQYRSSTGGNSSNNNTPGLNAPYWVRLVRSGNTFTGYRSANGVAWTQIGTTTISMGATVYVGLAVTSHNNSSSCAATFDNVSVPGWSPWQGSIPAGLTAVPVSTSEINLSWNALTNATSYEVKRSAFGSGPYTPIASGVTATNYLDGGLAGGTMYYYVVSAVASGSETPDSAPATAATWSPTLGSLAHRYSFSETSGVDVADSVGGPVWNGTLPNGGTFSGGQLIMAAGSEQHAQLPAGIVSTLNDFTIVAWVRLNSTADWNRIFDFGSGTAVNMFLTPQNGFDGRVRFAITTSGGGGEQQINCNATMAAGVWYQVAVALNGNTGILYLNGLPVGTNSSMTLRPSSLGSTANNYIGRSQYPDPHFNGVIDEFRIHNEALSPSEIAATYALGPTQLLSTNSPPVNLTATPTELTLSWPLAFAGFTVQSTTNLASGNWGNVLSPAPQIVGDQWKVTLPAAANPPPTYYRLVK